MLATKFESKKILLIQIQSAKGHWVVLATKFQSRKCCYFKFCEILPVGCHPKPHGLPGITATWFLEVGHVTLFGNQYVPSPILCGVPNREYAG